MALTDQAKALIEMVYRVGAPRFHELSVAQARHSFEKLQFVFGGERVAVGAVTDVPIARGDGSTLLARLYRPLSATGDDLLPIVIYYHGGGWCVGDVGTHDGYCRRLANKSRCLVFSVDYRRAPESPFPAAVDDAFHALDWVAENADLLGGDAGAIALAGDSAGGTLAIVTALAARDTGGPPLRHLALIYPCTEIHSERESRQRYGQGYFLDYESLRWFFANYLGDRNTFDWRSSPMEAGSLRGLPSITLVTAECDPLTDDCTAFADRVCAEGGRVERAEVAGVVHGFATLIKLFPEAEQALDVIANGLRRALFEA